MNYMNIFIVGQSSKVCGHAICSWRHHGASHWLFNYQWSGDNLLLHQNYEEDNVSNEKIRYPGENVSKTRLEILHVICMFFIKLWYTCTLHSKIFVCLWLYLHVTCCKILFYSLRKNTNFYYMLTHLNHDEALTTYCTTWTAPIPSQSPNAPPLTVIKSRGENGG